MEEKIKELTLLLLYLTSWKEKDIFGDDCMRAWKGYDFDVLNHLDDEDFIRQGDRPSRRKSVYLTETGIDYAKELLEKYGISDWK